jgi:hypothetical protein
VQIFVSVYDFLAFLLTVAKLKVRPSKYLAACARLMHTFGLNLETPPPPSPPPPPWARMSGSVAARRCFGLLGALE